MYKGGKKHVGRGKNRGGHLPDNREGHDWCTSSRRKRGEKKNDKGGQERRVTKRCYPQTEKKIPEGGREKTEEN